MIQFYKNKQKNLVLPGHLEKIIHFIKRQRMKETCYWLQSKR